ncbi:preprotein translocase subunit SecA [Mesomycoplasma hyopneumoniae]|uniref:Protein translocase subunit SecA n=1 Tax=Mesomycoplasma hyopneumoniae (strain 232) TaxID=295358 RepID=SECA_MESH2|nr:preprotein translocase subunit SecA [Mesomycoplasma hyopneumoniae]Q601A7.2 RecName: Full=Protein translocase subunit SecA [Mesomycoplasma hyopneumoniae 232]OWG15585.1 protein translocase subunit SecA [Mesomycoplasma hyopneumoniae]VEU66098.1 preprotein translocase subunit SecA [Mesomycoplasma hyopneumoniae]
MKNLFNFFKTSSELRLAYRLLKQINQKRSFYGAMTDFDLANQTNIFKKRLANGEKLKDIRVDAFAVAREATKRILGKTPYDVQILGGLILDMGSVAEMKTGEGKTIASIPPVYLNALLGQGVIVSTVNEYLAERDAEDNGKVYNFLGLTVGINKTEMDANTKRMMYNADITYSVHSELGFDYLRDNMVFSAAEKVQRGLNFCLIDEVDSILIDEAKTPLIISGGKTNLPAQYLSANQFVNTLIAEDFYIDEETKGIKLNDKGIDKANAFFGLRNLYEIQNSEIVHRIQNALRANKVMKRDVEYIVQDGKIALVDQFTGRIMAGRSYSEGLQQALQAKEGLEIEPETKTLATITYQNFFRLFKKLSGMTGTAKTEEQEFIDVYNMRVNVIPTNKPMIRKDERDEIFATSHEKNQAIISEVERVHKRGQPILIGTSQVVDSETLSEMLNQKGLYHTVLNAKQNQLEAEIIAKAGRKNAITIATNMAGRGTDIILEPGVTELGGLYILGTDKAEARRIDNQLRGRSGRQGDVGISRFFISLQDQLFRRFTNFDQIFGAYGQTNGAIKGKYIHAVLLAAQKKIEGFNFDMRKTVLSYDDVIRQQRDLIYAQRDILLQIENFDHYIQKMIIRAVDIILNYDFIILPNQEIHYKNLINFLNDNLSRITHFNFGQIGIENYPIEQLNEFLIKQLETIYFKQIQSVLKENLGKTYFESERYIILSTLDSQWQNHIDTIDKLRSSANLVQYSQKNPYQIFTEEATKKFNILVAESAYQAIVSLFNNSNAEKIEYIKAILSDGTAISYPADSPQEIIDQIIASNEERIAAARKAKEEKQPEFIEKQLAKLKIEKVESGEEFELWKIGDSKLVNLKKEMPLDEKQNILVKMQQEQLEMMSEEEKNLIQEQNLEIVEIEEIEEEIQNENPQKVEFVDFKNDPDAYNKLIFGADYADKQLISSEEEDNNEKTNINNNEDLERTKGEAQQTAKNPNE